MRSTVHQTSRPSLNHFLIRFVTDKYSLHNCCFQAVGCDSILGSGTELDHCGVCGGNGGSCRRIHGIFKQDPLKTGKTKNKSKCLRAATDESQKTLNKCETRNKTVFDTRLRHPETINSVPLNSVLRIKQTCV